MAKFGVDCNKVPKGMIVGTVEIVEVIDFTQQSWEELRSEHLIADPHPSKRKGWKLTNPQCLESPIYCRPLPGIFVLSDVIAEKVREGKKFEIYT